MTFACLGWGSLVWDPRALPVVGNWRPDGPSLPVEFARESTDMRMTLVIVEDSHPLPTLWAELELWTIDEAKNALADREGVSANNIKYSIGFWERGSGNRHGRGADTIATWAEALQLDGVVWTNLKWGFCVSRDRMPTYEQLKSHLDALDEEARGRAEEYVRRTPSQIRTPYRLKLAADLNWHSLDAEEA